jgi:hypothetical protein
MSVVDRIAHAWMVRFGEKRPPVNVWLSNNRLLDRPPVTPGGVGRGISLGIAAPTKTPFSDRPCVAAPGDGFDQLKCLSGWQNGHDFCDEITA